MTGGVTEEGCVKKFWTGVGKGATDDLMSFYARPSFLRCLPSSSQKYCDGLNKILFILDRMNIAFDEDVVHAEKVGAPIEHVAKTAPYNSAL